MEDWERLEVSPRFVHLSNGDQIIVLVRPHKTPPIPTVDPDEAWQKSVAAMAAGGTG